MNMDSSVVSHFTSSATRYAYDLPARDHFAMRAFEPFAEKRLKVLELGCGTGHLLAGLSAYYPLFDIHGLDVTPAMIGIARASRPKSIEFMLGNCLRAPFKSESFDAVIMHNILHHLVTGDRQESSMLREAGLQELIRLVEPQGFIVLHEVCVSTRWRSALIFYLSRVLARLHVSISILNIHTDIVANFFSLDELEHSLATLGLSIVRKEVKPDCRLRQWITAFLSCQYHVDYLLKRGS